MNEYIDEIFEKKRRVLLVDDEENNLSFMARCLHKEPYELVKYSNAIDALEIIKQEINFKMNLLRLMV